MANRYWVGGTANWDGTAGTKWALTSGGAGGQAVPTSADDVFFDGNSGANTVTISAGNTGAKSITCTGFTGTLAGTAAITVSGSVTLVAGMTVTYSGALTLNATATLTSAGKTLGSLIVNGSGITVTLGDALLLSSTITITQGTFDTANFNLTADGLLSNNSNTRTITLGSSTVTLVLHINLWNTSTTTGLTFTSNTCTVSTTSNLSKTFNGGGFNFNGMTLNQGGSGALTITGSNTFGALSNSVQPTTFTFTAGTTTTVTTWSVSGTPGKLVTIGSATAASHTLSKSSGTVNASFLSISNSTATGGATWNAIDSTDGGNNSGWLFRNTANFLMFFN